FSGNRAGTLGGGLLVFTDTGGTVRIVDSTFTENSAGTGGGLYIQVEKLTMTGSTVDNNRALGDGGGMYVDTKGASPGSPSPLTFMPGSLIANSTIGDNGAAGRGGGIYFDSHTGDLNLYNVTISHNAAANGGGVFHDVTAGGTVYVGNTLIALNTATSGP